MAYLFKNFAYCALTADVDNSTTTFPVDETGRLPANGDLAAEVFVMTVESTYAADGFETVRVTAKDATSGPGNLTVQRGYEGETPTAHANGTVVKGAITAAILNDIYGQISNAEFTQLFGGDWTQAAHPAGTVVRYRGGLFGSNNPIYSVDLDPLTPSDYGVDGAAFYVSSSGGTTSTLTTQAQAAQSFQTDASTVVYGVLLEMLPGQMAVHQGETIHVGIATSLGGGTPTYVVQKAWVVSDKDAARDSLNVVFDAPVTLAASTQYYVVLVGDSGATGIVSSWLYDTTGNMTIAHGATGSVITNSMYDAFYDATFSTNLTGNRFWAFLMNTVTNDWVMILPPRMEVTLPTADATQEGRLVTMTPSSGADSVWVCVKLADSSYAWKLLYPDVVTYFDNVVLGLSPWAYYKLDAGGSDGTTMTDSSGNGHHGTFKANSGTAPTTTTGPTAMVPAVSFVSGAYATLPTNMFPSSGDAYTIVCWIKPNSLPAGLRRVVDLSNGGASNDIIFSYDSDTYPGGIMGGQWDAATNQSLTNHYSPGSLMTTTDWHMIAFALASDGTPTLYFDGTSETITSNKYATTDFHSESGPPWTVQPGGSRGQDWVGRDAFDSTKFMDASMCRMMVFDRALTTAELDALHAAAAV